MIRELLENIKSQVQQAFPKMPCIIVPKECYWIDDIISEYIDLNSHLDKETVLWAVERICQSGKTNDEALQILGILPHNHQLSYC